MLGDTGVRGGAEVPRPELERLFLDALSGQWEKHLPPTCPHLTRAGISLAPPAGFSRKVKVKGGREGFGAEEITAP